MKTEKRHTKSKTPARELKTASARKHGKTASSKCKSKRTGFTSETASAARRKFLAENPSIPTSTIRVYKTDIAFVQKVWPKSKERIEKCSRAIRESALSEYNSKLP